VLFLGLELPDEVTFWIPDTEDAVEGRLPAFGGCGKAAMLIVLRSDLSGLLGARLLDVDRAVVPMVEDEWDNGDLLSAGLGLEVVRSFEPD
jgi:hypothetical protein